MKKNKEWSFWSLVARLILKNRVLIILILIGITLFWSTHWKNIQFTFSEANLLPDSHIENLKYSKFKKTFGEEGNIILIAVKDSLFFEKSIQKLWKKLNSNILKFVEIESLLSINNIQELVKNKNKKEFILKPFSHYSEETNSSTKQLKQKLFLELPFYENLIFDKKSETIRSIIYMDQKIVNTSIRKDFIYDKFIPIIEAFERETKLDVKISGMPYVRTLNAQNIVDEIGFFVFGAILVTSIIFFLFFRSIRATLISLLVVSIGVMWAFGLLGYLGYEITVLTALIPPLIIVIGIPNCVFLINKYQQEISKHSNQAKSLQRVIIKIGNATLMTNMTTASGFATFILTNSKILKEFGLVASLNILGIFIISLLVIPICYSFMRIPKQKHLKHLKNKFVGKFVRWTENIVRKKRINVYIISLTALIMGIIGIYQINISGSLLEDMPKKSSFFKDIKFYDENFNGIVPLEILIDSKREDGILKPATLNRMNKLHEYIDEIPELSKPISIVNVIKYSKQAYYNGNSNYYSIPTSQENSFIFPYISNSKQKNNIMLNYVDSTGQYARITTFMKDINTQKIEIIEKNIKEKIKKIFNEHRYNVELTGKAVLFLKGTKYLINNLIVSLSLAIMFISIFMAFMFKSFKMILISLIPNILPLIITAGIMGYSGIPLKPSTILVFSIAFGISVDDTIHFLAKYRQELMSNGWKINSAIFQAIRETGVSMFYTSVILFFGFSVFIFSHFGGTKALGGLVSVTLFMAMTANLILLPSLIISLEKSLSNKNELKASKFKIIDD
jgi:predicted RND superfamily exporter protein